MSPEWTAKEFDELWADSVVQAGRQPTWDRMTLAEQQWVSSRFRREMKRYGDADPTAENRMDSGLYSSPTSSNDRGSLPG